MNLKLIRCSSIVKSRCNRGDGGFIFQSICQKKSHLCVRRTFSFIKWPQRWSDRMAGWAVEKLAWRVCMLFEVWLL